MALGANRVLLGGRLQPLPSEGSMGIVAIGTLDQPLFHLVMEGHRELRLDIRVALETQRRLRHLEQTLRILTGMNAVASEATHIRFAVARTLKVGVLTLVAAQTPGVHFFCSAFGGIEDLVDIAAAVDVSLSGSMAVFAGDAALAVHQRHPGVRIL